MNLCDLHCDVAFELQHRREKLDGNKLDITLDKIHKFDKYVQLSAVCAYERDSDDEAYDRFFAVLSYFSEELKRCSCVLCRTSREIALSVKEKRPAFIMTIEDARLLGGDLGRLEKLFDAGVRLIAPMWGGETIIGGSHESDAGLTPFGKEAAVVCAELGIITDISHASLRSADELINIAVSHGKPVIASHSCAYDINPHSRNLRREHLKAVSESGGVVGVNLYPPHLARKRADAEDVARHLKYYTEEAGTASAALGCDFDGMGDLKAEGLESLDRLPNLLSTLLEKGFNAEDVDKIFFSNAYSFLIKNIAE